MFKKGVVMIIMLVLMHAPVFAVEKIKLAVMDLDAKNVPSVTASIVSGFLRDDLYASKKYAVVERNQMEKILKEQAFQKTGSSSSEGALQAGRILNVSQMMIGSLSMLGKYYYLSVRIIDVETGETKFSDAVSCSSEAELVNASSAVIAKLTGKAEDTGKADVNPTVKAEQPEKSVQKEAVKVEKVEKETANEKKEGKKVEKEKVPINVEISLYDFVDKSFDIKKVFHSNVFLLACNYKLLDNSKKLAVTFGPYFSENHGSNDIGLRASGYFYPYPENLVIAYTALSGAGGYSLANSKIDMSLDLKMGVELPLGQFEIFGEVGVGLQKDSVFLNLMVNSGVRAYIF